MRDGLSLNLISRNEVFGEFQVAKVSKVAPWHAKLQTLLQICPYSKKSENLSSCSHIETVLSEIGGIFQRTYYSENYSRNPLRCGLMPLKD